MMLPVAVYVEIQHDSYLPLLQQWYRFISQATHRHAEWFFAASVTNGKALPKGQYNLLRQKFSGSEFVPQLVPGTGGLGQFVGWLSRYLQSPEACPLVLRLILPSHKDFRSLPGIAADGLIGTRSNVKKHWQAFQDPTVGLSVARPFLGCTEPPSQRGQEVRGVCRDFGHICDLTEGGGYAGLVQGDVFWLRSTVLQSLFGARLSLLANLLDHPHSRNFNRLTLEEVWSRLWIRFVLDAGYRAVTPVDVTGETRQWLSAQVADAMLYHSMLEIQPEALVAVS